MKPEEQRIAIHSVCHHLPTWDSECDPLDSLDAMHIAEDVLTPMQQFLFFNFLAEGICKNRWEILHSTAAQRAEAFLRALSLWRDE